MFVNFSKMRFRVKRADAEAVGAVFVLRHIFFENSLKMTHNHTTINCGARRSQFYCDRSGAAEGVLYEKNITLDGGSLGSRVDEERS